MKKLDLGKIDVDSVLFSSTGMQLVDLMLQTKLEECADNEIGMDIFVNTMIDREMETLGISEEELVIFLGELVRNAIHSIIKTAGTERNILVVIAYNPQKNLEFQVYDSGVSFPQLVFDHLGERRNEEAGTGNGLADIVRVLDRVQASIEITPIHNPDDVFTKRICVCFDEKSERIFHTS